MKTLFLCSSCLYLGLLSAFSQHAIKGKVYDNDGYPIAFATLLVSEGEGIVCDSLGYFNGLMSSMSYPFDVNVQALGYIPKIVSITSDTSKMLIVLERDVYDVDAINVGARQTLRMKSSVSVITASKKEIEMLNPQNVGEVLQTKAGFTNRSGYQTPITLRGMSGKSLLVLRNGNRRFSTYPAGYMSHTINVYDLERIEVEKGAASVIYGAGAMAGIINLIDKSPFKQKGMNGKISTGYGSVNAEKNLLVCGGWSDGKLAIKGSGRYRKADDFLYSDGTIAENSFYTDKDFFVSAGYQFRSSDELVFSADIHDGGPWGKAVGFNGSQYMRVKTNSEKSNNYSLSYTSQSLKLFDKMEWNAFYSNESRELMKHYYAAAGYQLSYLETTNFSDYYYGTRFMGNMDLTSKCELSTGAEIYSFHISTPTDAIDYIDEIEFSNRVSHNARSVIGGLFLQNNFKVNRKLKLTAGVRYDFSKVFEGDVYTTAYEQEITEGAFSGNLSTSFRFTLNSTLKVNVARSFRMPESTELFTDNYTSNGILYGNPALKPEFCYSFDVCYNYSSDLFNFEWSPFIWLMDDMISKEELRGMPGTNYQYLNIGKTRIWGAEASLLFNLESILGIGDELNFTAGVAYLNGTDVSDENGYMQGGIPLDYVPPFNVKMDMVYVNTLNDRYKYNFSLRAIAYAEQNRLGESPYATPAYVCLGLTAGISDTQSKTRPSVRLAVNNLLNVKYYSYLSYLPAEGRDVRLFITFNFN